ncbi:MAG: hypothetical protein CL466_08785 [Acidimicrobiaceae bacterium]|nr:hypothetical protein [Acidimicrobiaceae bacterium]
MSTTAAPVSTTAAPVSTTAAPTTTLAPAPSFSPLTGFAQFSDADDASFRFAVEDEFRKAVAKAGVSVAVFDGERLWTYTEGTASSTEPLTSTTPMVIRSTSKTFLGALMTEQIENGLYGLDDTIEELLFDHPDYELIDVANVNTDATVEQLLTMTSGIADWSAPEDLMSRIEIMLDPAWRPARNLSKIKKSFVPPGSYSYSYANSIILGLIAEKYGGKPLNSLYQERFFGPLGLSGGLLPDVAWNPDTAIAYDYLDNYNAGTGFGAVDDGSMAAFRGLDPRVSWAGAGIVSTAENVAVWGYELFSPSGSAISDQAQSRLLESVTVETDTSISGLGVHTYGYYIGAADVSLSDGTRISTFTHPGGGGGRTSWLYYAPSLDVSISLLANSMVLHDFGACRYQGWDYVSVGECMAGGIFSSLLGLPVFAG